ncbi:MBL fold metallo-hydrolase [Candidatus Alkanophaga liquidiphilum]
MNNNGYAGVGVRNLITAARKAGLNSTFSYKLLMNYGKHRSVVETYKVAKDVYLIDVEMWTRRYGSVYVVEGEAVTLVESGLSTSAGKILEGLAQLGFHRDDVRHIVVSHVHLDHAGGAGVLAKELPNAKVVVHKVGAPHLIDPSRLLRSASKALGQMRDAYGLEKVVPVAAERVVPVDDGDVIDVGSHRLKVIYAPGHASHHICLYDEKSNGIFTGDAVGVYYPDAGILKPTTPPPEFDMDVAIESIGRLRELKASALFFSHFGMTRDVERMLDMGIEEIRRWGALIQEALSAGENIKRIAARLVDEFKEDLPFAPEWLSEQLAPVMVAGYVQYFERKGMLER